MGRQDFGVVVRTIGLLIAIYGAYTLLAAVPEMMMIFPSRYGAGTYVVFGLTYLLAGVALLRGEWIVRLAYGKE